MTSIHDVLPPDMKEEDNLKSPKKILNKEGEWAMVKYVLGFNFDGNPGEQTI